MTAAVLSQRITRAKDAVGHEAAEQRCPEHICHSQQKGHTKNLGGEPIASIGVDHCITIFSMFMAVKLDLTCDGEYYF